MVIQCFFCAMTIASFNNNEVQYDVIKEEYDYHLLITSLNETQHWFIENDRQLHSKKHKYYDVIRTVKKGEEDALDPKFDIYIFFRYDADRSYERFLSEYEGSLEFYGNGDWKMTKTPLLDFSSYRESNSSYYIVTFICLSVLGFLIMYALYYIRTGYFKFTYGIFMTFGGGYRKIYSSSFWEMAVVSLTAIIPSSIFSTLLLRMFYSSRGIKLHVHSSAYFISISMSLIIVAAALIVPCKRISSKTPISNIIAGDNSDKVISPRNSTEFWHVSIPKKYSLVTAWRFRKHNAVLALISALFIGGSVLMCYGTTMYCRYVDLPKPEYTLRFADNSFESAEAEENNRQRLEDLKPKPKETQAQTSEEETSAAVTPEEFAFYEEETEAEETEAEETKEPEEEPVEYKQQMSVKANYSFTNKMEKDILSLDGVAKVERSEPGLNTAYVFHLLISPENVGNRFEYTPYPADPTYAIIPSTDYRPYNWESVKTFFHSDYEGEIYEMPDDCAIVSNNVGGKKMFDFRPGDRIKIPIFYGAAPNAEKIGGENSALSDFLKYYNFEYVELTVAAVVEEFEDCDTPVVYIPQALYDEVAGDSAQYYIGQCNNCREVYIYADSSLDSDGCEELETRLCELFAPYKNAFVERNYAEANRRLEKAKNTDVVFYTVAIFTAITGAVVILFAQRMFNIKREEEFGVVASLGIEQRKIAGMLFTDAAIMSASTFVVYIVVIVAGTLLLHKKLNNAFGTDLPFGIQFRVIVAGALLAIISYFAVALISYISFLQGRKNSSKINLNF